MHIRIFLTVCLLAAVVFAVAPAARAADDARRKDPLALISQMRAKSLVKQLNLSEEQHKKVQDVYDEEARKLGVIQADNTTDINQKYEKQMVVKKETDEKLLPIFTEEQKAKYAELKANTGKKKNAATPKKK